MIRYGDDCPLRVYVMFRCEPEQAGIRDRIVCELAKVVYDEYFLHCSLNSIRAGRGHEKEVCLSLYTDRARLCITGRSG